MRRHDEHKDDIDRKFDELLAKCLAEYERKQRDFGIEIESYSKWFYSNESCVLTFSKFWFFKKAYSYTPVGTYSPSNQTWCWAWANDAIPADARIRAAQIKTLAEQTGYKIFESPVFQVDPQEIDELSAFSLHALNGRGIFKIKERDPWLYLLVH